MVHYIFISATTILNFADGHGLLFSISRTRTGQQSNTFQKCNYN